MMDDRLIPPHQIDAEQSLLGGLLNDNSSLELAFQSVGSEEFYKVSHGEIFKAMLEVKKRGEPVDIVTVTEELYRKSKLEECGGASYLSHLTDWVVTSKNAGVYARIIREKAQLRRMIQNADQVRTLSYRNSDPSEILRITKDAIKVLESGGNGNSSESVDMASGVPHILKELERRVENRGTIPGLATGLEKLDQVTCGMWPQDVWVLAARPGQGKTALSLNITTFVARHGTPVLWFSLDMSRVGLWERLICTESRVNLAKIRSGNIRGPEWESIELAGAELSRMPIKIIDSPCTELDISRLTKAEKPGLVVIDFLTKVKPSVSYGSINNDYGAVSKSIKNLAKEMDIPILLLCQLSRSNEKENRAPRESDLRDSGEIEQDADTIIFIHSKDKSLPERELIIAKQRQGECCVLRYLFDGGNQLFHSKKVVNI